jgi:hypothetical protein
MIDCVEQIRRAIEVQKPDINDSMIMTVICLASAEVSISNLFSLLKATLHILNGDSFSGAKGQNIITI